jgi:hypothetical protein
VGARVAPALPDKHARTALVRAMPVTSARMETATSVARMRIARAMRSAMWSRTPASALPIAPARRAVAMVAEASAGYAPKGRRVRAVAPARALRGCFAPTAPATNVALALTVLNRWEAFPSAGNASREPAATTAGSVRMGCAVSRRLRSSVIASNAASPAVSAEMRVTPRCPVVRDIPATSVPAIRGCANPHKVPGRQRQRRHETRQILLHTQCVHARDGRALGLTETLRATPVANPFFWRGNAPAALAYSDSKSYSIGTGSRQEIAGG